MSGMTVCWRRWDWKLALASWLAIGGAYASSPNCALAQPVADDTLGAESSVVTPNVLRGGLPSEQIDGGAIRGTNLFHSFQEFNIEQGRGVYFSNPAGIENILSRVTGGNASKILGRLGVLGNANLFLINPNGIIFGPNASLDIRGSFVASTASSLKFADGKEFSATAPQTTPLLTISVPIGLQYGTNPGSISNQSTATNSRDVPVGLAVEPGKTLALVGGDVSLDGGRLQAPGGRVELGGLASSGSIGLDINGSLMSLIFPDNVQRADVYLTNSGSNTARINVAASNGGSIGITARNIDISGRSEVRGGLETNLGFLGAQAGDIDLNAQGAINIANSLITNDVTTGAVGNGGNIDITAGSLSMTNGAQLESLTRGQGDAGRVNINARDTVSFVRSVALSEVEGGAVGNTNGINIAAGSLSLTNSELLAHTKGKGNAGTININARDTISLDQSRVLSEVIENQAYGNSGSINITTGGSLFLTNRSFLATSTFGVGNDGTININARDRVSFTNSSAFSEVENRATGNSGGINITTLALFLTNSELLANTKGKGNTGTINLNVRDTISLDHSRVLSQVIVNQAYGNSGGINITTGSLFLTNEALLATSTFGVGNGGTININARDIVSFDGGKAFSRVEDKAIGNSGDINITAGSLFITNGGELFTSTNGKGNTGNVTINARDRISLDGGKWEQRVFRSSKVESRIEERGQGRGGNIYITTGSLSATNGAFLSTSTNGEANAGNVTINARDIYFAGKGEDKFASGVYSRVANYAKGQGGDIQIVTESLSLTDDAIISTALLETAEERGGNIDIITKSLSATNGALVSASTFGVGNAGNVTINARDIYFAGKGSDSTSTFSGVYSVARAINNAKDPGQAGNIQIATKTLSLIDGATISAKLFAEAGTGGNITLSNLDLLLMRHGSIIDAAALNGANGGNITINAKDGFIVAVPKENSDIVANAFRGNGGRINITTSGIYGLEKRSQQLTDLNISEINASSEFGTDGAVELNTPDIDPNSSLINLPSVPVDTEVVQSCTGGGTVAKSQFTITGRGGLPPNPGEALNTDAVQVDLVTLNPQVAQSSTPAVSTNSTSPTPARIVEATGWIIDGDGNVVLTANPTTVTSHSSWQRTADCRAFKQQPGG